MQGTMEHRTAFQERVEKELHELLTGLQKMKADQGQYNFRLAPAFRDDVRKLETAHSQAVARLEELKEKGEDEWEALKDRVEHLSEEAWNAYKQLLAKVKK